MGSHMRPLFVLLGLLVCLIPIQAGEQGVVKDSEAIRYVGRYVEVRGFVVSVTTSPFGTTFQFRTRIPQPDVRWVHSTSVKIRDSQAREGRHY